MALLCMRKDWCWRVLQLSCGSPQLLHTHLLGEKSYLHRFEVVLNSFYFQLTEHLLLERLTIFGYCNPALNFFTIFSWTNLENSLVFMMRSFQLCSYNKPLEPFIEQMWLYWDETHANYGLLKEILGLRSINGMVAKCNWTQHFLHFLMMVSLSF